MAFGFLSVSLCLSQAAVCIALIALDSIIQSGCAEELERFHLESNVNPEFWNPMYTIL